MHQTSSRRLSSTIVTLSLSLSASTVLCSAPHAQSVYKVSPKFDSIDAPSCGWLPGLKGGFRKQIFIGASRLVGLRGKVITGFVVRRNLGDASAYKGGRVNMTVRLSITPRVPHDVLGTFAKNVTASSQTIVFHGGVTVPDSPIPGPNPVPWSAVHSFTVPFSSHFTYSGGTLCLEIEGRPVVANAPHFWYADHEWATRNGRAIPYGRTCSQFYASGETIHAEEYRLQIGTTMRLLVFGRNGSSPILLLGAAPIASGIDLSRTGASGCSMYVVPFVTIGLWYAPRAPNFTCSFANFLTRIPPSRALLGVSLFAQSADLETALPRSQWSNAAGLTTSNGLELRLSSFAPTLELSCVTSYDVDPNQAMPSFGQVHVGHGPVMRFLYR